MAKDKQGFQLEIIPNMYDIGLFKSITKARKTLRITTLIGLMGLFAAFWGGGAFIHYWSPYGWLNTLIVIAIYAGVLVVGYWLALTIGDVIFAGPWLKKMHMGSKFVPDNVREQSALLKNRNIVFILLWFVSIVALGLGCDFAVGGHLRWFHSIGGIMMSMRSSDDAERVQVLRTISNPFYDKKWQNDEIREQIIQMVNDPNDKARGFAAYITGKAKMAEAADNLMALAKDTKASAHARSEAVIALGRLEWKPARSMMLAILRQDFAQSHRDRELLESVFYAFFEMKDSTASRDAIAVLETCLQSMDCGENIYQYAFFYLKSLRIKDASEVSFNYLNSPGMAQNIQCYAADILRFTASADQSGQIKTLFDQTPKNADCKVKYRKYHEEAAVELFDHKPMRALYVHAIGNLKLESDYDWIWMVGSNQTENMQTRKVAETYARAAQQKEKK